MILTDLTQFKVQRRRTGSKWIREYKGIEINITEKKVQIRCDTPECDCVWQGNLVDYFDKDYHECRSCRIKGEKNPRGMSGKSVWNKGLTKDDDVRIATLGSLHSLRMSGANNPNFGLTGDRHPNFGKSINAGKENPAYKDGKSYERWTERHNLEQRQWAKRVKARDGYICQACKRKGGKLVSHHLFSYSTHPDLRNDDANGVCLCVNCHKDFHDWNGGAVKACTPDDYSNWMKEYENSKIQTL